MKVNEEEKTRHKNCCIGNIEKPSKVQDYNEQKTLGEAKINYVVPYWKRNRQGKMFGKTV